MPTNKPEVVLPELPYELEVLAARLYADAYQAGHNATVEGEFIDLHPNDRDTYWLDRLREHEDVRAYAALTRPADGEYDRELIASMLEGQGEYTLEAMVEQARLLRAADNREAAGAHTATVNGGAERHFYPTGPVGGWCTRCGCGNDSANFAHLSSCASPPAPGPSIGDFVMVPRAAIERAISTLDADGDENGVALNLFAMLSAAPQQSGQGVGEVERGMQTPRRVKAVELLLSLGYQWDGAQWAQPQQPAEAVAWIAEKTGRSSFTGKVRTDRAAFLTYPADAEADGYRITPLYLTPPTAIDIGKLRELRSLLLEIRPKFGQPGSRDVEVRAQQQRIDAAIALIGDGGGLAP